MILIKSIDEQIIDNIKFEINPVLEFACAVGTVGKREMLFDMVREMNFTIKKDDEKLLDELEQGISKYMRSEIEYFFSFCELDKLIAAYAADYEGLDDVPKFLEVFDNEDTTVLFKYLGGIFIYLELAKLNQEWDEVKNDLKKMRAYIENSKAKNTEAKEKLLECLDNAEETKQRLNLLFRQLYQKAYIKVENTVFEEIKKSEQKYVKLLQVKPQEFITKYFFNFFKIENKKWEYKFNIHLSFFLNIYFWNINLHDYKEKQGWVVVGIRTYEFYFNKEAADRVEKFLKVLSDKRRVDIIRMLSVKPYYGYEIAAKLELTPATVNYHINLLMDADILTFDREDNKIYFTINKDKVKELLSETSRMLINEPL